MIWRITAKDAILRMSAVAAEQERMDILISEPQRDIITINIVKKS